MTNILLVCSSGMSTSILVKKIMEAGAAYGEEIECWAIGNAKVYDEFSKADVLLIGPQMRFRKAQITEMVEGKCKVGVIDMQAYGMADGDRVLKQAFDLLGKALHEQ